MKKQEIKNKNNKKITYPFRKIPPPAAAGELLLSNSIDSPWYAGPNLGMYTAVPSLFLVPFMNWAAAMSAKSLAMAGSAKKHINLQPKIF